RLERGAKDPPVLGEDTAEGLGAELMQELGRALDIGEQESYGAHRKVGARHVVPLFGSSHTSVPCTVRLLASQQVGAHESFSFYVDFAAIFEDKARGQP